MASLAIRNSAIRDWMGCRRLFRWRWLQGWTHKGIPPAPLLTGQLVHYGLEAWHREGNAKAAAQAIQAHAKSYHSDSLADRDLAVLEVSHGQAQAMLLGYSRWYADEPRPAEQHLEVKFQAPLSLGVLKGTIDRLVRLDTGWWIMEHKTTSDSSQSYFDAAAISWQVFGYMLGARTIVGEWPRGIIYNTLQKSMLRHGKKETQQEFFLRVQDQYLTQPPPGEPHPMFRRIEILLAKRQLVSYMAELQYVIAEIRGAVASTDPAVWYPNTSNCIRGHQRCTFLETCAAYEESPSPLWFEQKEEEIIHV